MENTTSVTNVSSAADLPFLILYTRAPEWAVNIELALMAIVIVFGVPGNILIISVQANILNKTTTDYLVMIMAMYELFGSSVNAFTKIAMDIESIWSVVASPFVCKVLLKCCYKFGQYGSALMLGALAIDRCIKTLLPLNSWYTVMVAHITSLFIFILTLAVSVPFYMFHALEPVSGLCELKVSNVLAGKYIGIAGSGVMLAVFIVMSTAYASIALFLRRRHLKKLRQRRNQPMASLPDASSASSVQQTEYTTASSEPTEINTSYGQAQDRRVSPTDGDRSVYIVEPSKPDINDVTNGTTSRTTEVKAPRVAVITLEGRNINRITVLMFLISLIYVLTNTLQWVLFVGQPMMFGYGVFVLSYSIPMLNCVSNPVMFFSMSSRFRHNVKALFCSSRK